MTNGYVNAYLSDGRKIITRLHEHGPGEGYLEGKYNEMKAMAESSRRCLELWNEGELKVVLLDVEWFGVDDQSYDDYDHAVCHIGWKE
jgi:hypothetical protein